MSASDGANGYSCADCYFRQELVCALRTQEICPTFRPALRAADKVETPRRVTIQARALDVAAATARTSAPTQAPIRVAAAARSSSSSVVMPDHGTLAMHLEASPAPAAESAASPAAPAPRSRVAERVARRFPSTVQA